MSSKDLRFMAKRRLSDRVRHNILVHYSQKGRTFASESIKKSRSQENCGNISSVTEGVVKCRSGYIVDM